MTGDPTTSSTEGTPGAPLGGFAVDTQPQTDGSAVLCVLGEVDIATAPLLWERLEPAILAGPEVLVLDLAGLTFIDSTGLTVLIRAHKRLRDAGSRLVVRNPTVTVNRVLDVSGLDQVLEIEVDGR